MKLTQARAYVSIVSLPETELPNFTVLTGPNGSGKSHLLEAIANGSVHVDDQKMPKEAVGLYSWQSLVPNEVGSTSVSQVHQHRDWFLETSEKFKAELRGGLIDVLASHGLDVRFRYRPWDVFLMKPEEIDALGEETAGTFKLQLAQYEKNFVERVRRSIGQDPARQRIINELASDETPIMVIEGRHFDEKPFHFYGSNLFQHSFGEMFLAYFEKQKANDLRSVAVAKGRSPDRPPLSDEEFVEKHGSPPWEFVNDMMERAKLDFQIDHPLDVEATQYVPKLTKKSSGARVQFGALSSGEKILMSFAFCIYQTTDQRQRVDRPKLLLFDEVDAPLHPSMSRTLIEIVNEILVQKEGIKVILVTHSPSTVAVAPEGSIYLMESGTNRITAEGKRRAVSTLTADIPTMSIDFSGRRQVFVESDFDASRYGRLYQLMAPSLDSERSLSFIGVGQAPQAPNGSAQVAGIVQALSSAGNTSVLGLLDWDRENTSTDRVIVLGEGSRYAIENYLLDPLLLAAAVLNEDPSANQSLGLDPATTYASFSSATSSFQHVVDAVQNNVLAKLPAQNDTGLATVRYRSGHELNVRRAYLEVNGHELEAAVLKAFPKLNRLNGTGKLLFHMIDAVIRNHPGLAPSDLQDLLKKLCDLEIE